jgi:hypothetical protein
MKPTLLSLILAFAVRATLGCGSNSPAAAPGASPDASPGAGGIGGDSAASPARTVEGGAGNAPSFEGGGRGGADAQTGAPTGSDASVLPSDEAGAPVVEAGGPPTTLSDKQTLVPDPSWTCGMPNGIPPPQSGSLVFQANLMLGQIRDVGQTQYGHRYLIEIKGGTLTGPKIKGQFGNFGLDWQLTLSNGAVEDEQVDVLTTDDGTAIYFRNCGTAPGATGPVRMVSDFEAPTASVYAWLNSGTYAGTRELDMVDKTLTVSVYDVSAVTPPADSVRVTDPPSVPNQTWDCKTASGSKTTVVYTESVGIATGSVTVGASKRGTRNIVPITGGTTSGKIQGSVLAGGADYQLSASSFQLDARYTLLTGDGALIVVRNCGPIGSLVPVFETRSDGRYAWVNANRWLSSDPSVGAGVVNLTIYDTQ